MSSIKDSGWDILSTKLVLSNCGGTGNSSWYFYLDSWQICKSWFLCLVFSSLRKNYVTFEIALLGKDQKKKMFTVSKLSCYLKMIQWWGKNARTVGLHRPEFKFTLHHFPTVTGECLNLWYSGSLSAKQE